MKQPAKLTALRLLQLGLALAISPVSVGVAGPFGTPSGGVDAQTDRELVRRQQDLITAQHLIATGDRAMSEKDYATAYTSYLDAVNLIGSGPAVVEERAVAISKFSTAAMAYARDLIDNGRYADAELVAKTVLLREYNPTYKPAIQLLANLEQPDYYNKTVTPEFAADRKDVARLFTEAEGFYSRGSYDLAIARYEEILNIDRYNIAARKGMEKVDLAKSRYYTNAYDETRSRMLWEVTTGWELPVKAFKGGKFTDEKQFTGQVRDTAAITSKLNRIIVPNVNWVGVPIRDAVNEIRNRSRQLDPDPDKSGVNIYLQFSSSTGALPSGDLGGALPAPEGAAPLAPAGSPIPAEDTQITLSLNNVPLYEVLKYLAQLAGMKVKIEPVAVSIVPLSEPSDDLITKEYKVPPNFLPTKEIAETDQFATAFTAPAEGAAPRVGPRMTAREYLESQGVQFPAGANANYTPAGSRLVVRNTQDNIDLIDVIVDAVVGVAPNQVEIESRFVEINQNNLKELGFDWLLGPFAVGSTGVYMGGGTPVTDSAGYSFTQPGQGSPIGSTGITTGLRGGQGVSQDAAITLNAIDALLSGIQSGAAPGMFSLAGIFTNPQFQVVIRALDQKKGIDLMSAPKVTTKSGQKATVSVIREFRYPTEFDPPQIPQSTANLSGGTVEFQGFITSPVITPTTPTQFTTRNIGVTLDVDPQIGADGYTIDLTLSPEVVDFDGFVNYGTPIRGLAASQNFSGIPATPRSVVVSPNVINQPIFTLRKVQTQVTIWDGNTLALGGLIREDVQKVQDKVPFLGDVPVVGRLFRSDVDQKLKKNLIIFVTCRILNAEGRPVRSELEAEETVEALGLPGEIPPPQFPLKGGGWK
jgi:general secretion pathway protein D